MNSNLLKFILIIFLASFINCQKNSKLISDLIIGRRDWVNSAHPWAGQFSNPQTVGYLITLEFTDDGYLKKYRNDKLTTSTNYSIELNSTYTGNNILIYDSEIRARVSLFNDSLILNSAYIDGPVSKYIRLK